MTIPLITSLTEPTVIDAACTALQSVARRLRDDVAVLRPLAAGDEVGRLLLDRADVAAQHAIGCAVLAEARLAAPGAVVARSLLEGLFGT